MQYRFFVIPTLDPSGAEAELNAFLGSHRVLAVHRDFVQAAGASYWAYSVEYLDGATPAGRPAAGKGRIDYRELLDDDQFTLFRQLRDRRKEVAEAEGVPVYTVFTNEQLAAMVRNQAVTAADLGRIDGIGEVKLKKYADRFLPLLTGEEESAP